jgi:aspartate racemase
MPPRKSSATVDGADRPAGASTSHASVIDVLGGMGPAATVDFYAKLVALCPAKSDQAHPRVVIWADPTVPDRSSALTGQGADPTPWLLNGAERLQQAGATIIAIPCNTAHAFLPRISDRLAIPVVHMIDEVARHVEAATPDIRTVGLLATTGTVLAGLYQERFRSLGTEVLVPEPDVQRMHVDAAIRSLKAGVRGSDIGRDLAGAATGLVARGAELVIAGCTEIPLGLSREEAPCPVVDPSLVLARAVLAQAGFPWISRELAKRP